MEGSQHISQAQVVDAVAAALGAGGQVVGDERRDEGTKEITDPSTNTKSNTTNNGKTAGSTRAKRTKTGCRTCRKRRIKCGEERPTCGNCVKSKRMCEGYAPRVVFKNPLNNLGTVGVLSHANGAQFQTISSQEGAAGQYGRLQPSPASRVPFPPILPRRPNQDDQPATEVMNTFVAQGGSGGSFIHSGHPYSGQPYAGRDSHPQGRQNLFQQGITVDTAQPMSGTRGSKKRVAESPPYPLFQQHSTGGGDSAIDVSYPNVPVDWSQSSASSTTLPNAYVNQPAHGIYRSTSEASGAPYMEPTLRALIASSGDQTYSDPWKIVGQEERHQGYRTPQAGYKTQISEGLPTPTGSDDILNTWGAQGQSPPGTLRKPEVYAQNLRSDKLGSDWYARLFPEQPTPLHDDPDHDNLDVESETGDAVTNGHIAGTSTHDLGLMLAISASQGDKTFRSLTNYLNEPNVLATYHPTYSASPLMDPQTARVFCHFVTASAPTLSSCERHPNNPSIMFSGAPVPVFQQSLWTYSLPMLALSHQGLLHAMLAISSLHIAKLQHTSPTPALKHYHYALRRVAKALGQPSKRNHVATLAATLLLGWYEVTTAEHNKWNSHLAGARQLIMDIGFAGMTKKVKARKAQADAISKTQFYDGFAYGYKHPYMEGNTFNHEPADRDDSIDETFVSTIMGWDTRYDQYGHVLGDDEPARTHSKPITSKEIAVYEMQCDLFWWYVKQDMYQSIVSRNRLLLPYERWSHCPPRAPVGKLDAIYGTMDHLLLLMGRVADFAAKDQARKCKISESNQRQQNSQPGLFAGAPGPHISQQMPSGPPRGPPQPPPFYGMMPDPGPVHMPAGFDNGHHAGISTAIPLQDHDLAAATLAAEREWADISNAFDILEDAFGPDFQPLSPDHMQPLSTPFGPALYYRTYPISCVWGLFYTGRIITARCHPSMPAAAMVAAGVAAPRTAAWANTIGRVCAGLQPMSTTTPLNPRHGAALMDSCMGLFHAGVQYRDAAQRGWTITKLRDVATLTGWQTSGLIASGCERSWIRAAELGLGPPYERTMSEFARDERVAFRHRAIYKGPPKDNNDRRFITVNPGTRVYWALGILGAEEDMKELSLSG